MILLNCGASKWKKSVLFKPATSAWIYIGANTADPTLPEIPRLPMIGNSPIERVWLEYFREIHDIIYEHINDEQRHKLK